MFPLGVEPVQPGRVYRGNKMVKRTIPQRAKWVKRGNRRIHKRERKERKREVMDEGHQSCSSAILQHFRRTVCAASVVLDFAVIIVLVLRLAAGA